MSLKKGKGSIVFYVICAGFFLLLCLLVYSEIRGEGDNGAISAGVSKISSSALTPDARAQREKLINDREVEKSNFEHHEDQLFDDYKFKNKSPADDVLDKLRDRGANNSPGGNPFEFEGEGSSLLDGIKIDPFKDTEVDPPGESTQEDIDNEGSINVNGFNYRPKKEVKRTEFAFGLKNEEDGGVVYGGRGNTSGPEPGGVPVENIPKGLAGLINAFKGNRGNNKAESAFDFSNRTKVATCIYNNNQPVRIFEGDFIECVLTRKIVTDENESPVTVNVSRDFYERSGKFICIPRGTTIVGGCLSVSGNNANRLYLYFKRAILPNGESFYFPTRSVGLNWSGSAGVKSNINRHFLKNLSSSLLYGIVGAVGGMAQNRIRQTSPVSMMIDYAYTKINQFNEKIYQDKSRDNLPTISVRAGVKIYVYLTFDILISPYMKISERSYAK